MNSGSRISAGCCRRNPAANEAALRSGRGIGDERLYPGRIDTSLIAGALGAFRPILLLLFRILAMRRRNDQLLSESG